VELMVVLAIIAILIAVATPTLMGPRRAAQDTAAQATLVAALKTEEIAATDDGTYTGDTSVLEGLEPSLDWSGASDNSVHVVIGAVSGETESVLLYTKSNSGTWFGLRQLNAASNRYQCRGTAESNVDDLTDCTGYDW